jgi:DNA-directed RNA polymerase specialized sigma24 family protein
LFAVAVNGVSTAELADELDTTTGAIYKSLHDARRRLRAPVARRPRGKGARAPRERGSAAPLRAG